jgi:hypothetical protein
MTYTAQTTTDTHGAARSGAQREERLRQWFIDRDIAFIKTTLDAAIHLGLPLTRGGNVRAKDREFIANWLEGRQVFPATGDYAECGFSFFLADGYVPKFDAIFELKGGDKQGTTEEKLFFDLMKMEDGCYGDRQVFYIFEGRKEEDKCTMLFARRLKSLQERGLALNVTVVKFSEMDSTFAS